MGCVEIASGIPGRSAIMPYETSCYGHNELIYPLDGKGMKRRSIPITDGLMFGRMNKIDVSPVYCDMAIKRLKSLPGVQPELPECNIISQWGDRDGSPFTVRE